MAIALPPPHFNPHTTPGLTAERQYAGPGRSARQARNQQHCAHLRMNHLQQEPPAEGLPLTLRFRDGRSTAARKQGTWSHRQSAGGSLLLTTHNSCRLTCCCDVAAAPPPAAAHPLRISASIRFLAVLHCASLPASKTSRVPPSSTASETVMVAPDSCRQAGRGSHAKGHMQRRISGRQPAADAPAAV